MLASLAFSGTLFGNMRSKVLETRITNLPLEFLHKGIIIYSLPPKKLSM